MLRQKINEFLSKIKDQFFFMIAFMVIFVYLGETIPTFYLKYIDKTVYYSMELPIKVEKEIYNSGETVRLNMVRNSKLEMTAVSVVELVLIDNTTKEEVARFTRDLSITKGSESICVSFVLPEKLIEGEYIYQGTITYDYQGNKKYFNFYSEEFEIKNLVEVK